MTFSIGKKKKYLTNSSTFVKLGIEGNAKLKKSICENPAVTLTLHGDRKGSPLLSLLFNCITWLYILTMRTVQNKQAKAIHIGKKEVKFFSALRYKDLGTEREEENQLSSWNCIYEIYETWSIYINTILETQNSKS